MIFYLSVNSPIQIVIFFKHGVILYYTGLNLLTLKVATHLKQSFNLEKLPINK